MELLAFSGILSFSHGRMLGTRLAFSADYCRFRRSKIALAQSLGHIKGIESGGGIPVAGISKVQKVAKKESGERDSIGTCQCGGELKWARVVTSKPRMMQVCEKCGRSVLRGS
jgi:hypothetical protein